MNTRLPPRHVEGGGAVRPGVDTDPWTHQPLCSRSSSYSTSWDTPCKRRVRLRAATDFWTSYPSVRGNCLRRLLEDGPPHEFQKHCTSLTIPRTPHVWRPALDAPYVQGIATSNDTDASKPKSGSIAAITEIKLCAPQSKRSAGVQAELYILFVLFWN